MIHLDTNAVIAIMNRRPQAVREQFARRLETGLTIAISSIVIFELRFGIASSHRRDFNEEVLRGFLCGPASVLAFDEIDAAHAASVRALLKTTGTPIGPYDTLIAGQALRHGATLVTANAREFARVEGLKWEDWGEE